MASQNWKLIGTKTPEEIQQNEVYALLDRIQDKLSLKFNISIQPQTEDEASTQCSKNEKNSDLNQERPFQKISKSVDFIGSNIPKLHFCKLLEHCNLVKT